MTHVSPTRAATLRRAYGRGNRRGLSLLEVIIATGVVASSTVLLLSMLSTGQQHGQRGQRRVIAQMLCSSLLDELVANPAALQEVEDEPVPGQPEWTYRVDVEPMEIPDLVRVRVSVRPLEFDPQSDSPMPLDSPTQRTRATTTIGAAGEGRAAFSLTRWMRAGSVTDDDLVDPTSVVE